MGEPTDGTRAAAPTVEITVGKIGRAHGLRGEVFVEVRTDEPERRFATGARFSTPRGELRVESTRWQGARLVVAFTGTSDRDAAQALRGAELRVDVPADERPADPEEFYDHQLRGLAAHTPGGPRLGVVTDVLHLAAQDVLVLDVGGTEVLVPFVGEIVTVVDLESGLVEVADLPGLLTEAPPDPPAE
jgi:16S rRNA processing protein RimM